MKATILGAGNIGMALAEGLAESGACKKQDITLTKRNAKALAELQKKGFKTSLSNTEAIKAADTIFVCVLPQQLNELLEEIRPVLNAKKQLIVSVVTGAHTNIFKTILGDQTRIIRAMPNTAMKVRESMTCLSS